MEWERGIDDCIKVVRWRQGVVKPELHPLYDELVVCMEAMKKRGCFETYSQLDAVQDAGRVETPAPEGVQVRLPSGR